MLHIIIYGLTVTEGLAVPRFIKMQMYRKFAARQTKRQTFMPKITFLM